MTKKKQRFKKARELRRFGVPFGLAKKLANDLVANGCVTREHENVERTGDYCGSRCCFWPRVNVTTPKGVLVFNASMTDLVRTL
jgi:hypothetical protein